MNITQLCRPLWALAGALAWSFSSGVAAEPPSRAARLGSLGGTVSFSPAGQPDWVQATVNRPLTTGDRLWTDARSRAEVQVGGAAIRMGPSTSLDLLNLDNRIAQLQLSQGTLRIRVRSLGPDQTIEVATPNLAFTLRRSGDYRIDVDPQDDATAVRVLSGEGEVYGEGASYTVDSRQAYRFYGSDLSDYATLSAQRDDDLDRWSRERDRRGDNSATARYVSSEVVGYEDLDANGSWRVDATYGSVWTPTRVASGWTPYRDGHWSWIDPWGWTWVDDAPWGYAVSHYGRWAHIGNRWAWVPGPRRERAVYAPALVAFIGGKNFQMAVSAGGTGAAHVGWFPLAPREVYRPSYPVSHAYFDSINRSNAVIAPTTITTVYNTTIVNNTTNVTQINRVVYANQRVAGAVVAVPTQAFVQSQPVRKATVRMTREALVSAPIVQDASVAPVQRSVEGGAREAATRPPARDHGIIARTAPPQVTLPFAAQQTQLAARPGRPIDDAQRSQIKPARSDVDARKVSVVTAPAAPAATAWPPPRAPGGKTPNTRKTDAAREADPRAKVDKAEAAKAETVNADPTQAENAKRDAQKPEAGRAAAARTNDAAKAADIRADADRATNDKVEAGRAASAKAQADKTNAARAERAKVLEAKGAAARTDAAKADTSRTEAARTEAERSDAARVDAARVDAARVDAAQAKAARSEAAKLANDKQDKAKEDRAQREAASAKAAKAVDAEAAREATVKAARETAGSARSERPKAGAGARAVNAEAPRPDVARTGPARAEAARPAATRKVPAAVTPPESHASDRKSRADVVQEEEQARNKGRKP